MITRVEAKQYRCLRSMSQEVGPFQVLVGPNGSGKSVFMDVLAFLGTLVSEGLEAAVDERSENFHDLVWARDGSCFELGLEARIPEGKRVSLGKTKSNTIRYKATVRIDPESDKVILSQEGLIVMSADRATQIPVIRRGERDVQFQAENSTDFYPFELQTNRSALSSLPLDQSKFPAGVWFKELLREGVQTVALDNELLRAASAPYQGRPKIVSGFNLARLVAQLHDQSPDLFKRWLGHVQTSIVDLESIRTVLRPEDKHRYLMLKYRNGVETPSWVVSDGTLRLLALTILAYIPDFSGIYLVEEPENGVYPTALQTIYQSLSSVYDSQILVTSHSPILLNLTKPEELLCFQKTPEGTEITRGDKHPLLRDWKGEVSLSDLFAAGVPG
jgi:predicted ATPase